MGARRRRMSGPTKNLLLIGDDNDKLDVVIIAASFLESRLDDIQALRNRMKETYLTNWRFRSSVEVTRGRDGKIKEAFFVAHDVDEIPLDELVQDVEIPTKNPDGVAGHEDAENFLSSLYDKDLVSFKKPLFRVFNVTNLRDAGPGRNSHGLIVTLIHHLVGDGVSLGAFLRRFDDSSKRASYPLLRAPKPKEKMKRAPVDEFLEIAHKTRVFADGVIAGIAAPFLPKDDNILRAASLDNLSKSRRLAVSRDVDFEEIHKIKTAAGCTVNDVLVTCLASVVRNYLVKHSPPGTKSFGQFRAGTLMNARTKSETKRVLESGELGNRFTFLPVHLAVNVKDPLERLMATKAHIDDLKISPQPAIMMGLTRIGTAYFSPDIVVRAADSILGGMSTIFSSVPGSTTQSEVLGIPVQSMGFFTNSNAATSFGLLTYNKKVQMSIVCDPKVVSDPHELVDLFPLAVHELADAVSSAKKIKPFRRSEQENATDVAVFSFLLLLFTWLLRLMFF